MDSLAQLFGMGGGSQQGAPQVPISQGLPQQEAGNVQVLPPRTPEEYQQRASVWQQILTKFDQDPHLRQAMLVTGLKLMQPGANLGTAGLAGLATYNAGQQADLDQQAKAATESRAQAAENRAQASHALGLEKGQFDLAKAQQMLPAELAQTQAQANVLAAQVAAIPDEAARRKAALDLERLKLTQEPELARLRLQELQTRIAAANDARSATLEAKKLAASTAAKGTDQQRAIGALMANPEWADLPDAQKYMKATQEFYGLSRGQAGRAKMSAEDVQALDLYTLVQQDPESAVAQMVRIDPEQAALYQRGARLYAEQGGKGGEAPAPTAAGVKQPAAAPARRVITAEDLRKSLQQ